MGSRTARWPKSASITEDYAGTGAPKLLLHRNYAEPLMSAEGQSSLTWARRGE
jgi:hypothetical protein